MRDKASGFEEIEALIYRLFAEKQFALALLALVMVAQLLSAQFLLLRLAPPKNAAVAAPSPQVRVDLACGQGAPRMLTGEAMPESLAGKAAVVHLAASDEACLSQVSSAEPSELVVGMTDAHAGP